MEQHKVWYLAGKTLHTYFQSFPRDYIAIYTFYEEKTKVPGRENPFIPFSGKLTDLQPRGSHYSEFGPIIVFKYPAFLVNSFQQQRHAGLIHSQFCLAERFPRRLVTALLDTTSRSALHWQELTTIVSIVRYKNQNIDRRLVNGEYSSGLSLL